MQILWVKAGGLLPLDTGGKIRSYNLLRQLAQRHTVDIFTYYPRQDDDLHPQMRGDFHRVFCMPLSMPERASLLDMLGYARNLLSTLPYSIVKYSPPQVALKLRELVQRGRYDVILCDFLVPAPVLPWDLSVPTIVFTHNVEATIWKRHYQVSRNPFFKAVSYREYRAMDHTEHKYLQRASHVLTVSQNDLEIFSTFLSRSRMTVIQTGVDTDYFCPRLGEEQPNTLVFTGSMDWMPNEDAILWFAQSVLPLIRKEVPDVRLLIVGRRPPRAVIRLAQDEPSIIVTGRVEDIRPYIAQASVYIVPLRIGGGTRIKIFEAFAMGKAVVSTVIGAEGLPITDGKHILLADSPEDFAMRTVALLQSKAIREALGNAARAIVYSSYSWSAVSQSFDKVLEKVSCKPRTPITLPS